MPDYSQIVYKILVEPSNPQPPADAPRAGSNTELKGPFSRYGVDTGYYLYPVSRSNVEKRQFEHIKFKVD